MDARVHKDNLCSWVVFIPRILFLVVCCLPATMAIFCPRIRFRRVDFPTLGLPINET
jgi:hypothetical protein